MKHIKKVTCSINKKFKYLPGYQNIKDITNIIKGSYQQIEQSY